MGKYYFKDSVVQAAQFNYLDGVDGPLTAQLAEDLGLIRSSSVPGLWETPNPVEARFGWKIVRQGDWILTHRDSHQLSVLSNELFETYFEPLLVPRDPNSFTRAGGMAECTCGRLYSAHLGLTILCDGRWVKL